MWLKAITKDIEEELLEKLTDSYHLNNMKKINLKNKNKIVDMFIKVSKFHWDRGQKINVSIIFDLIFEVITGERKLIKGLKNLNMVEELKDNESNIFNYLLELLEEKEIKNKIKGETIIYINGVNKKLFLELLDNIKDSEIDVKNRKISLNKTSIYLMQYFRKSLQGHLIDLNERGTSLSELYYQVKKDSMVELKKQIQDISKKNGRFTTDLLSKGNKVQGIKPTKDIEDFSDYIGSSMVYLKKDKKLFFKQVLEKQVYKFEKPNFIQDTKRHEFNIYIENTRISQNESPKEKVKKIYLLKVLSTLLISDLGYVFKDITNWNIDIFLNLIPIYFENATKNMIHINIEDLIERLDGFIEFKNFNEVYRFIILGESKLLFNTINIGERILEGNNLFQNEKENKKEYLHNKRKRKQIGTTIDLFILVCSDERERGKKLAELKSLNKKVYCIFFFLDDTIEFMISSSTIKKKYSSAKIGFKNIRVDFLKEVLKDFDGK